MDELELKSEKVQHILSKPPQTIIRWGSVIVSVIFFLILTGSFIFKYPDIIQSEITITTEKPPSWIQSRSTGRISEIFISNKQEVRKGDLLAVIDNPANMNDIFYIKELLNKTSSFEDIINIEFPNNGNLGDLKSEYSALLVALRNYNNFITIDLCSERINALNFQLIGYQTYMSHLNSRIELGEKSIHLTNKETQRNEKLYTNRLISESSLEESERELLSNRQTTEEFLIDQSVAMIEYAKVKSELAELKLQQRYEDDNLKTQIRIKFNEFVSAINEWEQRYVLTSNIDGIISFNEIWSNNQNIKEGDNVFSIVNTNAGLLIGRMTFLVEGSGKVKIGQKVNIKIHGYPYMEYGFITGTIEAISLLPNERKYSAIINIPQDLKTSYGKIINFNGELLGTAEIITDNISLGERILNPIRYILNKNFK